MSGTHIGAPEALPERGAITDDQLMASVKVGSVAAFSLLYDRYCDRAYRVARSVCRDEGRAQEAVQETFISIWRARTSYEDRGNAKPFVLAVARFRAIDIARRHGPHAARRASEDSLDSLSAPGGVDEQAEATARTRRMRSLLGSLPDNQREAITLAFYGQLTHIEIATHLGIPLGTVKGRIRLGLMRLRGDIASERAGF